MLTHLLTFVALCLCILAFVRLTLEAASRFVLGEPIVGLVALGLAALVGFYVWTLRGILKEQPE